MEREVESEERGIQHILDIKVREGLTVKLNKSKSSRFTIRSKFDTVSSACFFTLGVK